MNVVNLRVYRDSRYTPLVIFVDPQKEYVAANRALELRGISAAIERCRELLDFTRANGFPTVFMRWKQRGKFFSSHQPFGDWIDGLSPIGSDMIFERALPSCYASEAFAELMDEPADSSRRAAQHQHDERAPQGAVGVAAVFAVEPAVEEGDGAAGEHHRMGHIPEQQGHVAQDCVDRERQQQNNQRIRRDGFRAPHRASMVSAPRAVNSPLPD